MGKKFGKRLPEFVFAAFEINVLHVKYTIVLKFEDFELGTVAEENGIEKAAIPNNGRNKLVANVYYVARVRDWSGICEIG